MFAAILAFVEFLVNVVVEVAKKLFLYGVALFLVVIGAAIGTILILLQVLR